MKIDPIFEKHYPRLSTWIREQLPKVKEKPKVWNAFLKYSELDKTRATWALTPGYWPDISFMIIKEANGLYSPQKGKNRVYLAKEICDKFETKNFNHPKMHVLIESTILHEMVHWGDHKDGVDQPGEEGKKFEAEAYGKDINRHW